MGKYADVVNPFPELEANTDSKVPAPAFEAAAPLDVKLPEGHRWVKETDFTGAASLDRPRSSEVRSGDLGF